MACVCLLVMVSRLDPELPLVVGANRDELLDRPAVAMSVLQEDGPRILGGRDLRAGGTWLAVNEHGVVAGLTNTPTPAGRDLSKRSRGELPLAAARHRSAEEAAEALAARVRPEEYNPAWLLVGDRRSLFAVTVAGSRPVVEELGPGVHVMENRAPGTDTPKTRRVGELLGPVGMDGHRAEALLRRLQAVLGDHSLPDVPADPGSSGQDRRVELLAACVHAGEYGTRSSAVVTVPGSPLALPSVSVADGTPCRAPFLDWSGMWAPSRPARR